jgi:hypothetical protein
MLRVATAATPMVEASIFAGKNAKRGKSVGSSDNLRANPISRSRTETIIYSRIDRVQVRS